MEQMIDRKRRLIESAGRWIMASLIAGLILFLVFSMHARDAKPCVERKCYQQLDSRLAAIEAEMKARTGDRYKGSDARRDRELIQKQIELLRVEFNTRIDSIRKS